jgi:hypothetical protein
VFAVVLAQGLPRAARCEPAGTGRVAPATSLPPAGWVAQAAPDSGARPQEARSPRRGDEGMRLTRGVYLGGALALSAGVLAWWSQDRADHAYGQYMRAAGVRRQARCYARSKDYDRVTGWAFVGMEAGLVLATYRLFF